jgi:GTP-binding protein
VVEEEQGVTRDRKELTAEWSGVPFSIMDTGGWLAAGDALEAKVSDQAERALAEADVILMVVDVTTGVTDEDLEAAKVIRRAGPPVRLVVNKVDGASRDSAIWEFVSLGLGDPYPVSSLHGRGTGDLLDEVVALLPVPLPEDEEADAAASNGGGGARGDREPGTPSVAIIGRPNVGKSTLFNKLLGEERAIVHDMPGTTRDAIDTVVETVDGPVRFIDTAGLRRPSKTDRWHRAARDHACAARARACRRRRPGDRRHHRRFASGPASGRTDRCLGLPSHRRPQQVGSGADRASATTCWPGSGTGLLFWGQRRCSRSPRSRARASIGSCPHCATPLRPTTSGCPPEPSTAPCRSCRAPGRPTAKIRYIVQGAIDPPTFTLFTNGRLPPTYIRYIERGLREKFEFGATPMKLRVRIGGK